MLRIAVLVSGGGTNLQAIIDKIASGEIHNTEIAVVISNNRKAYALERAKNNNIPAECISPKSFEDREEFHRALLAAVDSTMESRMAGESSYTVCSGTEIENLSAGNWRRSLLLWQWEAENMH